MIKMMEIKERKTYEKIEIEDVVGTIPLQNIRTADLCLWIIAKNCEGKKKVEKMKK